MTQTVKPLSALYPVHKIPAVLDIAINQRLPIFFLSQLTDQYQALTFVQLSGIKRFGRIMILLETGQSYEVGIELVQNRPGTYQEVGFADLWIDEKTATLLGR